MNESFVARLPERFRAAARQVVREYAARPEVLAALLAGSPTRGEAGPTSDLDIYVVADTDYRQRRSFLVQGVPVEIFLNPPARMARYLAEEDAHAMHMVGYGWTVYIRPDAAAQIAELQAQFRAAYERGPAPLSAESFAAQRYMVIDLLWDVDDVLASDSAGALLVMDRALAAALDLYYARQQVWRPKWKRLLADLAVRQPALAGRVRAYLAAPDAEARYATLRRVIAAVLPEGYGLAEWCWESSRDPVAG